MKISNRYYTFSLVIVAYLGLLLVACKKTGSSPTPPPPVTDTTAAKDTVPTDPATATTVGFFMDNWQPKTFTVPTSVTDMAVTSSSTEITVTVNTGKVIAKMPSNFFGNNSNLWIGQINQEPVFMNHLTNFQPRIIRGPAGSVSDVFFFNALNNTPPADAPANLVKGDGTSEKAGFWYGKNTDNWTFSTDGYYDMLQKTNSIGLLTANYGYARYGTGANPVAAAAHLAADWVRYDRGRTKYWEVGNECFGDWEAGFRINTANNKDGQPEIVTGALYGKHFRVFYDSMHQAATEVGVTIKVGAVLYDSPPQTWNTATIKTWNDGVFAQAGDRPDFYSVHSYFTNYNENSSATVFLNTATAIPVAVKTYVTDGMRLGGVPQKPIAMTEWNSFSSGSMQNVSHIAGMHAVITIGEFVKNGYGASCRWDLGNGWSNGDDHGLFSLGDEPGGVAKWSPRPAFYHMYYFQKCTGDRMIASSVAGTSDIISIATSFTSGQKGVILVNKSASATTVATKFQYFTPGNKFYYYVLSGGGDNGEFSRKVIVNGVGPANGIAGGPADSYTSLKWYATPANNGVRVTIPGRSVVFMVVDKK